MHAHPILVTGGTGFLGANLVHHLVRMGHSVHLLVRPHAQLKRLRGIEERLVFLPVDLLDGQALKDTLRALRPRIIFHLAGHGVYPDQKDRGAILAGNVQATTNLLAALEGIDYERLVHAGSSAEYGMPSGPLDEKAPLDPRNDYGVTKACATLLVQAEKHRGRPVSTVRIFTAFGLYESLPRLVPYVMDCCRRGEPPQLTAGHQKRDFIFAQDVIELLVLAAHHPAAPGQIFHAATGSVHSVREVVQTILAVTESLVRPVFGAMARRPDEPENWAAGIEHTAKILGWRPRFSLADGLHQTWRWFQSQGAGPTGKALAS